MADPITLPPLPEPAFSLRWERGEYKVSPPMDDCDCYTADQLRARDIEVARLVLEAAAKECRQRESVVKTLNDDQEPGTEAFWMVRGVMSASRRNAEHIRALEVRHHE